MMSSYRHRGKPQSTESKFCSICTSFLHTYQQPGKPDTIYVDGPLQARIAEACEICGLVYKSMGPDMARDFNNPDFRLSTTYMWIVEDSVLHLFFNEQVDHPRSGYTRSETKLERKFTVKSVSKNANSEAEEEVSLLGRDVTAANISWPLVKQWMAECSKHSNCTPLGVRNRFVPRRLIDVGTDRWEQVKLNSDVVNSAQYMTLSHQWGRTTVGQLMTSNILQMVQMIPEDFLSRTFKDSIIVTRALGYRYLWIDSLCIIQDSVEDWATESASMQYIYGNSACNISALISSTYSEGLSLTKPVYAPIRINILMEGIETPHLLRMHNTWNEFVTSSPLNLRGWVCQERLLSPRILHFSNHQLFWECGQLSANEDWPKGVMPRSKPKINPYYPKYILPHDDHDIKRDLSELVRANIAVDKKHVQIIWAKVMKLYTRASLTYATDRLVAISGIAAQFQSKLSCKYFSGLWECSITTDLLWKVEDTNDSETDYSTRDLQLRPVEYVAPTWSWASIRTAVDLDSLPKPMNPKEKVPHTETIVLSVLDVVLQRASGDVYGQLSGGYMRVQGRLATAYQSRGEIGSAGNDLNLEVSNEIRRSEAWPYTVGVEWDAIESIRDKKEFGKHLYYLLPIRVSQSPDTNDAHTAYHVEGLVLKATSSSSTFQRHGKFEWDKLRRSREEENRMHALNEGYKFFDEMADAQRMNRTMNSDGFYSYILDIV